MPHDTPAHSQDRPAPEPGRAIDPVCGMSVKIDGARHTHVRAGATHYFCSPRCKDKFVADPARYLDAFTKVKAAAAEAAHAPKGTLYTCPMHPEIV